MKQPTANALTVQTLKVLNLLGWHAWRQNNAAVYDPVKKVFRSNSATKGIPDILAFNRNTGRFLAAEIKSGRDTLSPEQTAFLDTVKRSGGVALVIRTVDDIENLKKLL